MSRRSGDPSPTGAPPGLASVLWVALFRNMNVGQGWAPRTGAALGEPFRSAGAAFARSFQTNGTVAFDPGGGGPFALVEDVRSMLATATGYTDLCVVLPVAALGELVAALRGEAAPTTW